MAKVVTKRVVFNKRELWYSVLSVLPFTLILLGIRLIVISRRYSGQCSFTSTTNETFDLEYFYKLFGSLMISSYILVDILLWIHYKFSPKDHDHLLMFGTIFSALITVCTTTFLVCSFSDITNEAKQCVFSENGAIPWLVLTILPALPMALFLVLGLLSTLYNIIHLVWISARSMLEQNWFFCCKVETEIDVV